jgi:predicted methyltransferase MtxX (methanogen marker protein 4)
MINKDFLGVFSKKIEELSKKGKVKIAFGLLAPDQEIEDSLKSVSEYADVAFVGPEAIKDIKDFEVIVDSEPEKKIASMLANNEVEGIIRGTIDDFKTADTYKNLTGEILDVNPGLVESPNGYQFFMIPASNPEGWEKEERLSIALSTAKFVKEWGIEPKVAYFTGVRHETYKRKKEIKEGIVGLLNKTYEDAEWLVAETTKAGYEAKNWSIDLDLAIQDGANIIVPANGMIGNQIFRTILLSGGRVLAGPRISCSKAYEDNSRNEKDFTFHVKWINAWINSKK